jgi:hypothetical protein
MEFKRIFLTVGATLAAGTMATVALADDGEREATAPPQSAITSVSTPLPDAVREQAATTAPMNPLTAQGYRLATRDATVWVVRGDNGSTCLAETDVVTCGPDDGGATGLLKVDAPPPHTEYLRAGLAAQEAGLSGEDAVAYVREATADLPPVAGPATFVGYISPSRGVQVATLIDADGTTIARTEVQNGLYDFRVADVASADPRVIQLEGSLLDAPITLGPFPAGRL